MHTNEQTTKRMRRRALAACLLSNLALATAGTLASVNALASAVTSCNDDPGDQNTLRYAVLVANPNDTIDLSGLACSKITLGSAIAVAVSDLTIKGAGADKLTIDGNHVDRVFKHTGTGSLNLSDLSVVNGTFSGGNAIGGCLYSKGNLVLTRTTVASCKALGVTGASGGGAFAFKSIILDSSELTGNEAYTSATGLGAQLAASGGGALAVGQIAGEGLTVVHSRVSGNTARAASGLAEGGGIFGFNTTVKYSTLSDNHAIAIGNTNNDSGGGAVAAFTSLVMAGTTVDHNDADVGGGIFISTSADSAKIAQSTISGNKGNLGVGGIYSGVSLDMANSTIAFNSAPVLSGLEVTGLTATLNSNIIADNIPDDLGGTATLSGEKNLIKVPSAFIVVPFGTISLDPDLGPLAYNGGATRTHALNAGSPAIDKGNNVMNAISDQRGGSYARVANNVTDIGAFELDPDHIFADRFGAQ